MPANKAKPTSRVKLVREKVHCKHCNQVCQSRGTQKNGAKRYYCTHCKKSQQSSYAYGAYEKGKQELLPQLVKEGVSMRGSARILKISLNTVSSWVKKKAQSLTSPTVPPNLSQVEVDELHTYVGKKANSQYISYSYEPQSQRVLGFTIGQRSKEELSQLIAPLIAAQVQHIHTDKLQVYKSLIPPAHHNHRRRSTNHIERHN